MGAKKRGAVATSDFFIYTDHEREFLRAIDDYKRRTGHKFPTWSEVLAVLVELGWRPPERPEPPPPPTDGTPTLTRVEPILLAPQYGVQRNSKRKVRFIS